MIDITKLYRLPYSKNDNPNGWVEITTYCNLKCPGCYRGCNLDDNVEIHEPLDTIKANIKEMQRIRNCQIISLSGGEPLLHPELKEIIRFIKESGMIPFVHTNGILLTEELIKELREIGLGGIIIRVDSLSKDRITNELKLNELRQKYAKMVRCVKGIHLTLLCVVNKDNLDELHHIIDWSLKNAKLVDFITFIPMRHLVLKEDENVDNSKIVHIEDLDREVERVIPNIQYSSFLGGTIQKDSIKWLQSAMVILNGKKIGYAGPAFIEFFQMFHHFFKGKYAYKFGKDRSYLNLFAVFLLSIVFKNFRTIFKNYLLEILKNPNSLLKRATIQLICYIIPPGNVNGYVEICEGCPDAILYKGNLVPSCGLEEIKKYGHLLNNIVR